MSEHPNVVLVTIDSLRADRCGHLGGGDLTPSLDHLAARGLCFENAVAPGASTLDTMPVAFTGEEMPGVGKIGEVLSGESARELVARHLRVHRTIPERLSELGYETGAFTANPWTSRPFGFDAGFDHFEDFLDDEAGLIAESGEKAGTLRYGLRLLRNWRRGNRMFQSWDSFYDDVVAWTDRASEPYFLWVFLVDVHMPYLPPAAYRTRSAATTYAANLSLYLGGQGPTLATTAFRRAIVDAYEDAIRHVDDRLDRFTRALGADDPVFVIHADHGEAFGEHGHVGHGTALTEEQVHVPLVVGNGPTGTVEDPVSLRSLPDLVTGLATGGDVTALARESVRTRNRDPAFAIRGRDWKYVRSDDGEAAYDLPGDRERPLAEAAGYLDPAREDLRAWRRDVDERTRIVRSVRDLAETHAL